MQEGHASRGSTSAPALLVAGEAQLEADLDLAQELLRVVDGLPAHASPSGRPSAAAAAVDPRALVDARALGRRKDKRLEPTVARHAGELAAFRPSVRPRAREGRSASDARESTASDGEPEQEQAGEIEDTRRAEDLPRQVEDAAARRRRVPPVG